MEESGLFIITDEASGMNTLLKEYVIELVVIAGGKQDSRQWKIVVKNRNHTPVIKPMSDLTVWIGDTIQLNPEFYAPDNENNSLSDDNALTIEYSGWMTDPNKTVRQEDHGTQTVTVTIRDDGEPVYQTITISVKAPNLHPYQPEGWDDKIVVSTLEGTHKDTQDIIVGRPCYIDYAEINGGDATAGESRMQLLIYWVKVDFFERLTNLAPHEKYVGEDFVLTGIKEKTALVRIGLEALIKLESSKRLAKLGGTEKDLRFITRRRSTKTE